ncbi:ABC transporter substrate-binding protein [Paenibacillus sp. HJL G12]|uniref:ABC transporter substrate-binding protein n=1 Tax=Paenibacillus dendrobii TaxID=2691084 RepID=A0A7X3LG05_9BACL|nr:helix-turn-helix domain-containing protein [Paenibacillus dendrobii]MWV42725.1 ABC transporter substrate-binding protein [Paenibacillus dendrobii]
MFNTEQSGHKSLTNEWLFRTRFKLTDAEAIEECSNGHRLLFSACPAYMLIVSARRHGYIVIDGILYALSPEKIFAVEPGQRVEMECPSAEEQMLYLLRYDISMPEQTNIPSFRIEMKGCRTVTSSEQLLTLCRKIIDHWTSDDPADRFASEAGFQDVLHLLFKRRDQHENILEHVRQYMELNYPESFSVDSLAKMAGMSRYHFMRTFKERYGQSAMDYLMQIRMNQAKQLMEDGHALRQIAEKVGYKDAQYFSSQFSKQFGISPSMYVANRKIKIAAYSWPNIGHLLTLQIVPYAAPIDQSWTDEYRKKYRFDIKVPLSHDYDFNLEALWRAKPDKIIALEEMIPDAEKEKLRQIAPVLFLPWYKENWRVHLQLTARFLDREEEADRWLARYDKKAAAERKHVPSVFKQGSLLILNFCPKGIIVWGKRAGTVLYDDLHIACAKGVEEIEFTEIVEAERLETFDADVMLIHVMKDPHSQTFWQQLLESQTWTNLKAVRNRHIFYTSGPDWIAEPILEYTANRHDLLLEELKQLFSAL